MTETVVPHHIEPENVLQLASIPRIVETDPKGSSVLEVCEAANGQQAFVVRNFHENFDNPVVMQMVLDLTSFSSPDFHEIIENLMHDIKGGWKGKEMVLTGGGGDSLILDPNMKGKNVEYLTVGKTKVGGKLAEWALTGMYLYGALKQLVYPHPNPESDLNWEFIMSVKGDDLNIIIPAQIEERGDKVVALDNGTNLKLHPGDAVFLPLGIARQLISSGRVKYFYLSAPWGGEKGLIQEPVYWQSQISK